MRATHGGVGGVNMRDVPGQGELAGVKRLASGEP